MMKKIIKLLPALVLGLSLSVATSCGGPTGNNNSTDENNRVNGGETDSTKMPGFGEGQQAVSNSAFDTTGIKSDTLQNNPR